MQRANAELGILTQAWSPIGGITFSPGWCEDRRSVLDDDTIARIAQNIDVFDFALAVDELAAIDALDRGVRGGPDPDEVDPSGWDLTIPEP